MQDTVVKSQMLNIRIDPETMEELRKEAERDDRTLSWLGLHYIKQGLEKSAKSKKSRAA